MPDLHVPLLLPSSSVLRCCFNGWNLPTYSLMCTKHPVFSVSFQRVLLPGKLFLKCQNLPIFTPGLTWKKMLNLPNHSGFIPWCLPCHSLWFLVTKIRHSPGWWGVSNLLRAFRIGWYAKVLEDDVSHYFMKKKKTWFPLTLDKENTVIIATEAWRSRTLPGPN